MKFNYKLLVLYLVVAVIPMFFFCIFSFDFYQRSVEANAKSIIKNMMIRQEDKINDYVENKFYLVKSISSNETINLLSELNSEDPEVTSMIQDEIMKLLDVINNKDFISSSNFHNDLKAITIANLNGKIIADTDPDKISKLIPEQYLQLEEYQGNNFKGIITDPISKEEFIVFTKPLFNGISSRLSGVLMVKFNTDELINICNVGSSYGNSFEVLLPYKQGNSIHYINKPKFTSEQPQIRIGLERDQLAQDACLKAEGEGLNIDYNQEVVFSAWKPIEISNWSLIVKQNRAEIFLTIDDYQKKLTYIFSGFLFLGFIIVFFFANNITKFLNIITDFLDSITKGQPVTNIEMNRNDELGKLSISAQESLWFQKGSLMISEMSKDASDIHVFFKTILEDLLTFLDFNFGVFYLNSNDEIFTSQHNIGIEKDQLIDIFKYNEGILGKICFEKKAVLLNENELNYTFRSNFLESDKLSVAILPIVKSNKTVALLELGSFMPINELKFSFLKQQLDSIAISLDKLIISTNLVNSNQKLQKAQKEIGELSKFPSQNPHPILRLDKKLTLVYNNPSSQSNFISDFTFDEKGTKDKKLKDYLNNAIKTEKTEDYIEFRNNRYYNLTIVYVKEYGYVNIYANDITDFINNVKQNEDKLIALNDEMKKQKEFYEFILNNLPLDVAVFDIKYRYVFVNPGGIKNSELREWIIGKDDYDYIKYKNLPTSVADNRKNKLDEVTKNKIYSYWTDEHIDKEGNRVVIYRSIGPLLDEDGEIKYIIGYGVNITDQKIAEDKLIVQQEELLQKNEELEMQAIKLQSNEEELRVQQEELLQSNQELEEKTQALEERNKIIEKSRFQLETKANELEETNKYKSEFLANMSHELRTPLNSIILLSKLLYENNESNLKDNQIEFADVIFKSGNNLLSLINEILDLSKIEAGKMDVHPENILLDEYLKLFEKSFIQQANQKGIQFEIINDENVNNVVFTDRLRLDQILKNLMSNAIKFTNKGKVSLSIKSSEHLIVFSVSDTGIGIPKDKQKIIFDAFQQADGSTRRKFGGTGLGLSISKQLAGLLGGYIELESEENKGSTFSLTIPISIQEKITHPSSNVDENNNKNTVDLNVSDIIPESIPDDRNDINKEDKVLIVIEDNASFAYVVKEFANKNGYKIIICSDGAKAFSIVKEFKPDGVLLDIQLPNKSGWTILDELKKDNDTLSIPVHIMSSQDISRKETIEKGAIDFINKNELSTKLNEVLDHIKTSQLNNEKNILIIENNETHQKALELFIQSDNNRVHKAINSKQGLKKLNEFNIDCVVLDMGLPDNEGYQLLELIRNDSKYETLPIIVFTGKSLSNTEEKKLKKYGASIILKTAESYKRLLDEISHFLHVVNDMENNTIKAERDVQQLKHTRVLIVDDDIRNIFSLTKLLESFELDVASVSNGMEAVEIVQTQEFDIILMDMMMPEMDGYNTMQQIREIKTYEEIPIIAVTAKTMLGDRQKCIDAGASDYISKPVDGDQLISLISIWLNKI